MDGGFDRLASAPLERQHGLQTGDVLIATYACKAQSGETTVTHGRLRQKMEGATKHPPEHWLRRAEEARTIAEMMQTEPAKSQMLRIAESYEALAQLTQEKTAQDGKRLQKPAE